MAEFKREKVDMFLGVVRKYMQVRGPMTQKELAELTEVGVSTMSRFLNQKSTELNPDIIARITAKLDLPFHEIIDFVDESFEEQFKRLVNYHKGVAGSEGETNELQAGRPPSKGEGFDQAFQSLGTAKNPAKANVRVGKTGAKRSIPFEPDSKAKNSPENIKDKLDGLSPRQKAYLTDFLNLDMESRDLMVDLGNNLFRYFKQKGLDF